MGNCNNCVKHSNYNSENLYTWCTNCGNYGIHGALKRALVEEELKPQDTFLCFDIGCNGNGADKIEGYRAHGLHGRVIPFAAGASIANSKVKVVASAGDGATLGEGINHLVHAIRTNYNVTFLLHNNSNYGLTTGQASPTTPVDVPMHASPDGVTSVPMNVLQFVLSLRPSFVARAYSGNVKHMTKILREGIRHQGFAFIEILQDCPTYNKATPHQWYMERVYDVAGIPSYDLHDITVAKRVSEDLNEKIAIGVIYKDAKAVSFNEKLMNRVGVETELVDEVRSYDIGKLLERFI